MRDFKALPQVVRAYGDFSAVTAAQVAAAGTVDQAAQIAAAVPVFGLIGQDFLAAFAVAQGNHLQSVGELAYVHAATSAAVFAGTVAYEAGDVASGSKINAIGTLL